MRPRSRFTAFVGPFPEGFPPASATGRLSGIQRNWAFAPPRNSSAKWKRSWPRAIGSRCPVASSEGRGNVLPAASPAPQGAFNTPGNPTTPAFGPSVHMLRCNISQRSDVKRTWANGLISTRMVESRCGAVSVGRTYLFPPLSSGGALVVRPWLRFHIPLIEPDVQISRIRLSDKTSRLCLACDAFCSS